MKYQLDSINSFQLSMFICYCFFNTTVLSAHTNTTIKVGVILIEQMSEPFDLPRVGPALSIAFENIERDFGIRFDPIYRQYGGMCPWEPPLGILSELYYEDHIEAVIGPACSQGVESASRLAQYLRLPMVSGLGDLALRTFTTDMFETLTKLSYNVRKISLSVSAIMSEYNWRHSVIMYDSKYILWEVVGQNLVEDFRKLPNLARPYDIPFDPAKTTDYSELLLDAKTRARVIIIICYAELFRTIMHEAYKLGMADGDFVYMTLELFPSEWMGFYREFIRDDPMDAGVTKAYETVLIVTLTQPDADDPEFHVFSDEVKQRAKDQYGYIFGPDEQVNYFITAFYDSALYLANAYNQTLHEGGNISDGMAVAQKLWNASFVGINGPVAVDETGERVADFDLLDMMSPETSQFQTVGRFRGASQQYSKFSDIAWPRGQPIDMPNCGFTGELCLEEAVNLDLIITISVLTLCIVSAALICSGVLYRRLRVNQEIAKHLWLVKPEEVLMRKSNVNGSILSKSRVSFVSKLSMASQLGVTTVAGYEQVFTQTGFCRSITVAVRSLLTQTLDLNKKLEIDFHEMHKLSHPNLAKFVGACVKPGFLRLLMEYCPRGSLQVEEDPSRTNIGILASMDRTTDAPQLSIWDIIQNDNIDLDWNFRYSLISDVIKGMLYLHASPVQTHGRLSSTNCVIDTRFMLKLTDFGLHSIFTKERQEERNLDANMRYRKMLWTAPEHLRRMNTVGDMDISQPGDVFSFSIILQEISVRAEPFQENNMEPHEIIDALVAGKKLRPDVTSSECPPELLALMRQCWEEEPSNRPTFVTIEQRFRKHRAGKTTNIMDNLLQRMSQYADNLEALAAERTKQYLDEKTRTEELLLRLLPKSVVRQLESGNAVAPELFESVTIYFSDIVGFTTMAAASTPIQVVDFLNELFTRFDKTVDMYDVYKVETIGDAYMVVSGLPERNGTRHVSEVANMALSMVGVVSRFRIKHRPGDQLRIRVGIHSGPVVAGVVGLTMPRYCLFGDTVNTASRMESTSEPMKIQLSSGAKAVIDLYPSFDVAERGHTEVKGKGRMQTYWLLGNRDESMKDQLMPASPRQTVATDPICLTEKK